MIIQNHADHIQTEYQNATELDVITQEALEVDLDVIYFVANPMTAHVYASHAIKR